MKILFNCQTPFLLAHGGHVIQIQRTMAALNKIGIEAEPLRWWDEHQTGDIIHYIGPSVPGHEELARQKGIKLVVTHLLGGLGVRPAWKRWLQKKFIGVARIALPTSVYGRLGWGGWQNADACIAITPWEAKLMREVFGAPASKVHVIPNGVSDFFFQQPAAIRGPWLITTASILPLKRLVETAEAAVAARVPYWVIGRPFSESDAYYQRFSNLFRRFPDLLRHDNVARTQPELAQVYRQARGFVLLSRWETQSLSALEAAACGCPLLLADLPWAHNTFGANATYCPVTNVTTTIAKVLREFYDTAPQLPAPPKPATWDDVAQQLKAVYEKVIKPVPET